jgi:hypothetical protein
VITHSKADWKATLSHVSNRKLHHFTLYRKSDRPNRIKASYPAPADKH